MARLRIPIADASSASVPPELLDADDPTWQSVASTRFWLRRYQIDIGRSIEYGPINRREGSAVAWAISAGMVNSPLANGWVGLDYQRARDLGVPVAIAGATKERWLRHRDRAANDSQRGMS